MKSAGDKLGCLKLLHSLKEIRNLEQQQWPWAPVFSILLMREHGSSSSLSLESTVVSAFLIFISSRAPLALLLR
ncbi:hypothetical protein SUGI_0301760 [Cryptomeria japonica]|nr:hypothetical protein SUGI_0301760 [Cryptomeria japonica]